MAEGTEMWDESENFIQDFIGEQVELERKDITIERMGITGSKINCTQQSFLVKFFKL